MDSFRFQDSIKDLYLLITKVQELELTREQRNLAVTLAHIFYNSRDVIIIVDKS